MEGGGGSVYERVKGVARRETNRQTDRDRERHDRDRQTDRQRVKDGERGFYRCKLTANVTVGREREKQTDRQRQRQRENRMEREVFVAVS